MYNTKKKKRPDAQIKEIMSADCFVYINVTSQLGSLLHLMDLSVLWEQSASIVDVAVKNYADNGKNLKGDFIGLPSSNFLIKHERSNLF